MDLAGLLTQYGYALVFVGTLAEGDSEPRENGARAV